MTARARRTALGRIVRSGVGRRRVQTVAMTLTTSFAVAASVLAAGVLVDSQAPFEHAFAAQHGSQLTAGFNESKVSAAQLAAAHAPGVTAAAGPYATASLHPVTGSDTGMPSGLPIGQLTVVGRSSPGGPVDDVVLMSGTWATGPGQIVMNISGGGWGFGVGAHLRFPELPGDPTLTVAGLANSVSNTADAWVTPDQLTSMTAGTTHYQMLYRFTHAGTDAQVAADRAAIAATLPAGALAGAQSWLQVQLAADGKTAAFVPFVAAFGILALAMSVLIVTIVVSSAVSAQTQRIGILKSLGFTPGQVVRAYISQALIPALAGAALGLAAGNLLAIPALAHAETAYGTGTLTIPVWVDAAVTAAVLALVTAAAWAFALRAGRLRTIDALAVGRTPTTGRGRWARPPGGQAPAAEAGGSSAWRTPSRGPHAVLPSVPRSCSARSRSPSRRAWPPRSATCRPRCTEIGPGTSPSPSAQARTARSITAASSRPRRPRPRWPRTSPRNRVPPTTSPPARARRESRASLAASRLSATPATPRQPPIR